MSDSHAAHVQQVFLAALEIPAEERGEWLINECGANRSLLAEVRSLLDHTEPTIDMLEQNLDEVIADIPQLSSIEEPKRSTPDETPARVDHDDFLSKLSEVGVLSPDEFASVSDSVSSGEPSADPRLLASKLVTDGKLTEYQASALLKGEPELLIDKYLILDLIDVGGMGMVFKAIHRTMNRVVAVKMISQQMLASAEQVKRFQREVRVAATLEHPNIVRAYDADKARGVNFLVMEYVRGENLSRIVRSSGPMSLGKAVDCIRQAAVGLQHAHKHGIVHRDIKPGNLLLDDGGTVKVLDLGLAHIDESLRHDSSDTDSTDDGSGRPYVSRSELTAAGAILGTASFMAPEQSLDAHLVDFRSDIYSLGCTLYFLLTGDTPYSGSTIFKVFVQHREAEIPSLQDQRPDVPDSIAAVFQCMVAKKPDDRFQSMSDLIVALDDCRIAPPETAAPIRRQTASPVPDQATIGETEAAEQSPVTTRARTSGIFWGACVLALVALVAFNWFDDKTIPDDVSSDPEIAKVNNSPPYTSAVNTATTDQEDVPDSTHEQASAADLLATGEWEWRVEQNLGPIINSSNFEFGADMTADGLTIVVTSARSGSLDRDLWMATRSSRDAPWADPVRLPTEINTPAREEIPRISADGLTLRFRRGNRLWITTRSRSSSTWSEAVPDPNAIGNRRGYGLTPDGLTAFRPGVVSREITDNRIDRPIIIWRRESHEDPFGESVEDEMPSVLPIRSPGTMSNDGRMYIFDQAVNGEGEPSKGALFMATRDAQGMSWSSPTPLFHQDADVSNAPQLLRNGRTLLFVSNRAGGSGNGDIWMARLVRKHTTTVTPSAAELLAAGEWEWQVQEKLGANINSEKSEWGADMTADGLTIVFSSEREGGIGGGDLWIANRSSAEEPWSEPVNLGSEINTETREAAPAISPDGLTLSFTRYGNGAKLMTASRQTTSSPWSQAVEWNLDLGNFGSPELSHDGLTLLGSRHNARSKDGSTNGELWIGRRSSVQVPWTGRLLTRLESPVNTDNSEAVGTLSEDGRLLFFVRPTDTIPHNSMVFMSTRANWDAPWSNPVQFPSVDGKGESTPRILPGGKSLLFVSNRPGGEGGGDIWMAKLVRKTAPP